MTCEGCIYVESKEIHGSTYKYCRRRAPVFFDEAQAGWPETDGKGCGDFHAEGGYSPLEDVLQRQIYELEQAMCRSISRMPG